tara:strand:+ start:1319 stop:1690 length:372 start_codon:yes stop_codon:yes gene_type:complete
MFANVSLKGKIFHVQVLKAKPENDEFQNLVCKCEKLYMSMNKPFILSFDLFDMDILGPIEIITWMSMFVRVMPITKEYLVCTFVCVNKSLKEPIEMFLKMYNPVKPFCFFYDRSEFQDAINKH